MSDSNVPRTPDVDVNEPVTEETTTTQTIETVEAIGQEATIVPVGLPAIGTTQTYQSLPGQRLELGFDATQAAASVEGSDLILSFDLDADGEAESQIIFLGLAGDFDAGQSPQLVVDGTEIASEQLINLVLAQAGDLPLETAAGAGAGPTGGGGSRYDDNLGNIIDLLNAQGVIPPTELQFGLIDPVPDIVPLEETPNTPPLADNVVTPVQFNEGGEGGGLPDGLQDAIDNLEGGNIIAEEVVNVESGGETGSVQYVSFTLTAPTAVTISTDGPTIDPQIYLLEDDGDKSLDDILATDDDDGPPAGSWFNSIIDTGDEIGILPAGDYLVAVSDFHLSEAEVVSGINGGEGGLTGPVTITVTEQALITDTSDIVMFKQLDVDGSIGDGDGGIIGTFGGSDVETSLDDLVFTLESLPQYGSLLLVTEDGSSIMAIGDAFDSTDTVWWFATENQISSFLEENELQFLPEPVFDYSVTDEDGGVANETVTITFPPPTPPETFIGVSGDNDGCLNEDTEGSLFFIASPTDPNSKISEIVVSGFPTGDAADAWLVDDGSISLDKGVSFSSASYNSSTGELTLTLDTSSLELGESVSGTFDVTPNPDSDVDIELNIGATAINNNGSAAGDSTNDIPVDADADGGEGGEGGVDDNDGDFLSVSASVVDSSGEDPENTSFQSGEVGTLSVAATFDDFMDGSETHYIGVIAPDGFDILTINTDDLPAGVTLNSNDGTTAVFQIDTTDGVGSVDFDLAVQNVSSETGEANFIVKAVAHETNTGDVECDDGGLFGGEEGITPTPGDNHAIVQDIATAVVTQITPPEVSLTLPGEVDCIEEDSTTENGDNVVTLTVTPADDDEITEIVITGFQDDWDYDLSGLLTGGAAFIDGDPAGGSITLSVPNAGSYSGTFAIAPPDDSDVDHPTLEATATVVDGVDAALTTEGSGDIDIAVDANADSGPGGEGGTDDGDDDDLSVSMTVTDSDDGDTSFAINESGELHIDATFDDFEDGSETHTITVTAASSFSIDSIVGSLPAGVTVSSSSDDVWVFDVDTTGLTDGSVSFDLAVTNESNNQGEHDFHVTATAVETNTQDTLPDDVECDDSLSDNMATVSDTATAEALDSMPGFTGTTLVHDESDGNQQTSDDDANGTDEDDIALNFAPLPNDLEDILDDLNISEGDTVGIAMDSVDISFGANGPGVTGFANLTLSQGTQSTLFASNPDEVGDGGPIPIYLYQTGPQSIVGIQAVWDGDSWEDPDSIDDDTVTDDGDYVAVDDSLATIAFVIYLGDYSAPSGPMNDSQADVYIVQTVAIDNDDPADHDESDGSIASEDQSISVHVMDADDDFIIGAFTVRIEDDGPVISSFEADEGAMLVLDESLGDGGEGDPNADDETNPDAHADAIGYAAISGDDLFDITKDAGTDGEKSTVYSLTLNAGDSGLVDTESGEDVVLSMDGDDIIGMADGELVLRISVDDETGGVKVNQFRAMVHPDEEDHDESGDPLIMNPDLVELTVTLTDGDDDTDTDSFDLGSLIKFEDDGPVAVDDGLQDTVDDNVVDANIGTVSGLLANDDFGTDGPHDSDSFSIAVGSLGGTITIDGDNLLYTSNTNVAPDDMVTETFTYTIMDGDDDTDTGTFTVKLTDEGPTIGDPTDSEVDEEGLAGGNAGDSYLDGGDLADEDVSVSSVDLDIDFGIDGAGDVTFDGAQPGLAGITSGGDPVSFVILDGGALIIGYKGAVPDEVTDDDVVFYASLSASGSGSYDFTLVEPLDHDTANTEDDETLTFAFTATDAEGEEASSTFSVLVDDDAPITTDDGLQATVDDNVVDENIGTVSGLLSNDEFGADGPHDSDSFSIAVGSLGGTITIDGDNLLYTSDTDVAPDGMETETFTYTIKDADGDTKTATFTVKLTDEGPTIGDPTDSEVDEEGLVGGNAGDSYLDGGDLADEDVSVSSVDLDIDFGIDGAGDVTFDGAQPGLAGITSGGDPVSFVILDGGALIIGYKGAVPDEVTDDDVVFYASLSASGSGSYDFTLVEPLDHDTADTEDDETLTFAFTATDAEGEEASSTFSVLVDDDAPTTTDDGLQATVDDNAVDEIIGTVSGLTGNDSYGADGPHDTESFSVGVGDLGGTITIDGDNLLYTSNTDLAPDGSDTETFTYTIKDADGDTKTATFTVDLTDEGPTIGTPVDSSVDEEGLAGGNADDSYLDGGDLAGEDVSVSSVDLDIDFGVDGAGDVTFDGAQPGLSGKTSKGDPVSYVVLAGGTLIIGYTGAVPDEVTDDDVVFYASLSASGSGSYDFTLVEPLDHDTANTEDDETLTFAFTATDAEGEGASSTFSVLVDDDAPEPVDGSDGNSVFESELDNAQSTGTQAGNADDKNSDGEGDDTVITGDVSALVSFGADGPGAGGGFSLNIDTSALPQDLMSMGEDVVYDIDGDTLWAYVENGVNSSYDDGVDRAVFSFVLLADGTWTFTLIDQIDHVAPFDTSSIELDLSSAIVATDGDGDSIVLDETVYITVVADDAPNDIDPEDGVVGNSGGSTFGGDLDFEDNQGADEGGDVTFSDALDGTLLENAGGVQLFTLDGGDAITLVIQDDGHTLLATTNPGDPSDETSWVFVAELDPDMDTYDITMYQALDDGSSFTFEDFSDAPAGNNSWVGIDDPRIGDANMNQDLLFTGIQPDEDAADADTVNTSSTGVGTNSQSVKIDDGLRIDYMQNINVTTGDAMDLDTLTYDHHYDVNDASFSIIQTGGPASNRVDALVTVYDADDDQGSVWDTADDPQDTITSVSVYDASDVLIGTFTTDGTIGDITVDFGHLDPDDVLVEGLLEGYEVFISTDDGFNRMEIINFTEGGAAGSGQANDSFDLGGFQINSVVSGSPIDLSFDLDVEDFDGDMSSGSLDFTVLPQLTGTDGDDVLVSNGDPEVLVGGLGDDDMTGGGGGDIFVFSLAADEGSDEIFDFTLSDGDLLSFTDVIDIEPDADIDVDDVIFSYVDGGGAGTVDTITLVSGTIISLTDVDDAFNSDADVFNNSLINGSL